MSCTFRALTPCHFSVDVAAACWNCFVLFHFSIFLFFLLLVLPRISTFLLYFLLPSDVTYKPHRIPLLMTSEGEESSSDDDDSDDDNDDEDDRKVGTKSKKKKSTTTAKKKAAAKGTAKKRPVSSAAASSKAKKKAKTGGGAARPEKVVSSQSSSALTLKERNTNMIKELEALPVAVLLARMDDAIQQNLWERKHQLIGSTICCRAVLQAAQSYDIQQELLSNGLSNIRSGTNTGTGIKNTTAYYFSAGGGTCLVCSCVSVFFSFLLLLLFFTYHSLTHSSILTPFNLMNMHTIDSDAIKVSRNFIMDWIEKSSTYKRWVSQMLLNMEPRSYQASITKSLLKTGWSRTSGAGRYMYVESISLVADWYCLFLYFITGIQLRFSLLLREVLPPSAPVLKFFVVLF